jgi:hypothetical protein
MHETDMRVWWDLAAKKARIERPKSYVPGFGFVTPHVSPFGKDRFLKFDSLPAFETKCGFLTFINR